MYQSLSLERREAVESVRVERERPAAVLALQNTRRTWTPTGSGQAWALVLRTKATCARGFL